MAKSLLIANAGPLIALAKVGRLHLLESIFSNATITESVRDECLQKNGVDASLIHSTLSEQWPHCQPDPPIVQPLMRGLGKGEQSCIQLALKAPNVSLLLLDDRLARKAARKLQLRFMGTAMLLCIAEERGLIPDAEAIAEEMHQHGYRISSAVFRAIRGQITET